MIIINYANQEKNYLNTDVLAKIEKIFYKKFFIDNIVSKLCENDKFYNIIKNKCSILYLSYLTSRFTLSMSNFLYKNTDNNISIQDIVSYYFNEKNNNIELILGVYSLFQFMLIFTGSKFYNIIKETNKFIDLQNFEKIVQKFNFITISNLLIPGSIIEHLLADLTIQNREESARQLSIVLKKIIYIPILSYLCDTTNFNEKININEKMKFIKLSIVIFLSINVFHNSINSLIDAVKAIEKLI